MYNLGTVFRFEVLRTLKKKSFWIMAIIFPIAIGAIYGIAYFSNQSTKTATKNTANQKFSFVITDKSGLINEKIVQQLGASETNDKQAAINKVENGTLDAYFFYPKDLASNNVEIYA